MRTEPATEDEPAIDDAPRDGQRPDHRQIEFTRFAQADGARLLRVVCAHFGLDVGVEVHADAMAWAWEHWDRVRGMSNPAGYLYRVAETSARLGRRRQRPVGLPVEEPHDVGDVEPGLDSALKALPSAQRVAVMLVHGLGWTYQEAADAMGVSHGTVRNSVHRGLARLRSQIGGGA